MTLPVPLSQSFSTTGKDNWLDGLTIVRFVRGYAKGAGLEYDVEMINRALCERFNIHIIQIHMAHPSDSLERYEVGVGRGHVTGIPLVRCILPATDVSCEATYHVGLRRRCKYFIRDKVLFNRITGPALVRWATSRPPRTKPGDVRGVGAVVREILQSKQVDLVMVHAAGGADAWEAVNEAHSAGVPSAMQLHFSNERFKDLSVRIQVARVDGVAGVSDVSVPKYLAGRFANMLTGLDLEFFSRKRASTAGLHAERPTLLLPARIVPTKGHKDLIEVVKLLNQRGIIVDVIFVGRADQPEYEHRLRQLIAEAQLSDRFHFLGLLTPERLRDLYATCDVLAFPTYHQEGLPRILLESQAMGVPVVVYDSGGSRAGLLPDKTGYLVSTGDVTGFASAICRLLKSRDTARSFQIAGRRFVENCFSLKALSERHEQFILRTIMASRTSRS